MANGFIDMVGSPMVMSLGTQPLVVGTNGAAALNLKTANTTRISIDSAGNIGFVSRLKQTFTTTDVDAQNNTLTVAQIAGGIVVHTSVTGGGTVTTDTAANIIAGSSSVGALTANGESILVYYINDGDQTLTLAGGTNVTISDTGQTIAANESAVLLFVRASSTTVTCHIVGA